ncbi:MAG: DUF481 domain-containing protein [Gammaproteobacteria bacterium]|nr:DUF481 domain-containing protein [Gammaproteobacteria bacterium]
MQLYYFSSAAIALLFTSLASQAQEQNGINTEVELGAVYTTGNTENENITFRGEVDWRRDEWEYGFLLDGFRASQNDMRTAQRLYYVAEADHNINELSSIGARLAHEDDAFSGYDGQTDISINYGRNLLTDRENMSLTLDAGLGARSSRSPEGNFDEAIIRLAGDYQWAVSETATFGQLLSTVAGDRTSIFRSESSIETRILDNLSLRFSINVRHQTEVPTGRKKTDTETAITFAMNF